MGDRPQQPDNNRAAPQCNSAINGAKKLPGTRKYEAKRLEASFSVPLPASSRASTTNRSVKKISLLFIVAAGCFSNMFTTYSHALCGCPSPAGLRLEISCESDKKKMNLNFDCDKKNFLTGKMKHVCRRENRNSVSKKFRATQTATIRNRRGEESSLLIPCLSRVDRIGLCAQFPASPSRGQTLSKL